MLSHWPGDRNTVGSTATGVSGRLVFSSAFFHGAWVCFGGSEVPLVPVCSPSSLQANWRGAEFPLAGSHLQGHHENHPAVPHICMGLPPNSHDTSTHLLVMSLMNEYRQLSPIT